MESLGDRVGPYACLDLPSVLVYKGLALDHYFPFLNLFSVAHKRAGKNKSCLTLGRNEREELRCSA